MSFQDILMAAVGVVVVYFCIFFPLTQVINVAVGSATEFGVATDCGVSHSFFTGDRFYREECQLAYQDYMKVCSGDLVKCKEMNWSYGNITIK